LPGYAAAGAIAPVLLVLLRIVQGLSAGGEFGGAVSLMAEFAPPGRRGLYGSWQSFTVGLGLLAGSGYATLLTGVLSADALSSWGWRLPFLTAIVLGVIAVYLRSKVDETPVFLRLREQAPRPYTGQPLRFAVPTWVLVFFVIGALLAWTTAGNVFLVVLPSYAAATLHLAAGLAQWLSFTANAVFTATIPLFGALSDRLGRRTVMLAGAGLILVLSYPLFLAIKGGSSGLMFACAAVAGAAVGMMAGPGPAMLAELFPARVRVTGLGLGYALSAAAFGGTAALIVGGLKVLTGDPLAAAYYPIIGGVVSLVCLAMLRRTERDPLPED
ncbi:MAG TPA: MFS transporter, partial [Pseudonocardiaceae bacterium]|nr:MFS transporter [Pseudonocardiaceae bacterium]